MLYRITELYTGVSEVGVLITAVDKTHNQCSLTACLEMKQDDPSSYNYSHNTV